MLLFVASFTKEVKPQLAKGPLFFNGRLANRGLTPLVKEATGGWGLTHHIWLMYDINLIHNCLSHAIK